MAVGGGGLEASDLVGNSHLDTEFLRLVVGSRHQRDAADDGRKAEVVFDARGGARLAAKGAAIEHE